MFWVCSPVWTWVESYNMHLFEWEKSGVTQLAVVGQMSHVSVCLEMPDSQG